MAHTEEEFETSDIYLAAYLRMSGCKLLRRRKSGSRVFFIFTNPAGSIKDLREAFFKGDGQVPANKYAQEIKDFKELCFEI